MDNKYDEIVTLMESKGNEPISNRIYELMEDFILQGGIYRDHKRFINLVDFLCRRIVFTIDNKNDHRQYENGQIDRILCVFRCITPAIITPPIQEKLENAVFQCLKLKGSYLAAAIVYLFDSFYSMPIISGNHLNELFRFCIEMLKNFSLRIDMIDYAAIFAFFSSFQVFFRLTKGSLTIELIDSILRLAYSSLKFMIESGFSLELSSIASKSLKTLANIFEWQGKIVVSHPVLLFTLGKEIPKDYLFSKIYISYVICCISYLQTESGKLNNDILAIIKPAIVSTISLFSMEPFSGSRKITLVLRYLFRCFQTNRVSISFFFQDLFSGIMNAISSMNFPSSSYTAIIDYFKLPQMIEFLKNNTYLYLNIIDQFLYVLTICQSYVSQKHDSSIVVYNNVYKILSIILNHELLMIVEDKTHLLITYEKISSNFNFIIEFLEVNGFSEERAQEKNSQKDVFAKLLDCIKDFSMIIGSIPKELSLMFFTSNISLFIPKNPHEHSYYTSLFTRFVKSGPNRIEFLVSFLTFLYEENSQITESITMMANRVLIQFSTPEICATLSLEAEKEISLRLFNLVLASFINENLIFLENCLFPYFCLLQKDKNRLYVSFVDLVRASGYNWLNFFKNKSEQAYQNMAFIFYDIYSSSDQIDAWFTIFASSLESDQDSSQVLKVLLSIVSSNFHSIFVTLIEFLQIKFLNALHKILNRNNPKETELVYQLIVQIPNHRVLMSNSFPIKEHQQTIIMFNNESLFIEPIVAVLDENQEVYSSIYSQIFLVASQQISFFEACRSPIMMRFASIINEKDDQFFKVHYDNHFLLFLGFHFNGVFSCSDYFTDSCHKFLHSVTSLAFIPSIAVSSIKAVGSIIRMSSTIPDMWKVSQPILFASQKHPLLSEQFFDEFVFSKRYDLKDDEPIAFHFYRIALQSINFPNKYVRKLSKRIIRHMQGVEAIALALKDKVKKSFLSLNNAIKQYAAYSHFRILLVSKLDDVPELPKVLDFLLSLLSSLSVIKIHQPLKSIALNRSYHDPSLRANYEGMFIIKLISHIIIGCNVMNIAIILWETIFSYFHEKKNRIFLDYFIKCCEKGVKNGLGSYGFMPKDISSYIRNEKVQLSIPPTKFELNVIIFLLKTGVFSPSSMIVQWYQLCCSSIRQSYTPQKKEKFSRVLNHLFIILSLLSNFCNSRDIFECLGASIEIIMFCHLMRVSWIDIIRPIIIVYYSEIMNYLSSMIFQEKRIENLDFIYLIMSKYEMIEIYLVLNKHLLCESGLLMNLIQSLPPKTTTIVIHKYLMVLDKLICHQSSIPLIENYKTASAFFLEQMPKNHDGYYTFCSVYVYLYNRILMRDFDSNLNEPVIIDDFINTFNNPLIFNNQLIINSLLDGVESFPNKGRFLEFVFSKISKNDYSIIFYHLFLKEALWFEYPQFIRFCDDFTRIKCNNMMDIVLINILISLRGRVTYSDLSNKYIKDSLCLFLKSHRVFIMNFFEEFCHYMSLSKLAMYSESEKQIIYTVSCFEEKLSQLSLFSQSLNQLFRFNDLKDSSFDFLSLKIIQFKYICSAFLLYSNGIMKKNYYVQVIQSFKAFQNRSTGFVSSSLLNLFIQFVICTLKETDHQFFWSTQMIPSLSPDAFVKNADPLLVSQLVGLIYTPILDDQAPNYSKINFLLTILSLYPWIIEKSNIYPIVLSPKVLFLFTDMKQIQLSYKLALIYFIRIDYYGIASFINKELYSRFKERINEISIPQKNPIVTLSNWLKETNHLPNCTYILQFIFDLFLPSSDDQLIDVIESINNTMAFYVYKKLSNLLDLRFTRLFDNNNIHPNRLYFCVFNIKTTLQSLWFINWKGISENLHLIIFSRILHNPEIAPILPLLADYELKALTLLTLSSMNINKTLKRFCIYYTHTYPFTSLSDCISVFMCYNREMPLPFRPFIYNTAFFESINMYNDSLGILKSKFSELRTPATLHQLSQYEYATKRYIAVLSRSSMESYVTSILFLQNSSLNNSFPKILDINSNIINKMRAEISNMASVSMFLNIFRSRPGSFSSFKIPSSYAYVIQRNLSYIFARDTIRNTGKLRMVQSSIEQNSFRSNSLQWIKTIDKGLSTVFSLTYLLSSLNEFVKNVGSSTFFAELSSLTNSMYFPILEQAGSIKKSIQSFITSGYSGSEGIRINRFTLPRIYSSISKFNYDSPSIRNLIVSLNIMMRDYKRVLIQNEVSKDLVLKSWIRAYIQIGQSFKLLDDISNVQVLSNILNFLMICDQDDARYLIPLVFIILRQNPKLFSSFSGCNPQKKHLHIWYKWLPIAFSLFENFIVDFYRKLLQTHPLGFVSAFYNYLHSGIQKNDNIINELMSSFKTIKEYSVVNEYEFSFSLLKKHDNEISIYLKTMMVYSQLFGTSHGNDSPSNLIDITNGNIVGFCKNNPPYLIIGPQEVYGFTPSGFRFPHQTTAFYSIMINGDGKSDAIMRLINIHGESVIYTILADKFYRFDIAEEIFIENLSKMFESSQVFHSIPSMIHYPVTFRIIPGIVVLNSCRMISLFNLISHQRFLEIVGALQDNSINEISPKSIFEKHQTISLPSDILYNTLIKESEGSIVDFLYIRNALASSIASSSSLRLLFSSGFEKYPSIMFYQDFQRCFLPGLFEHIGNRFFLPFSSQIKTIFPKYTLNGSFSVAWHAVSNAIHQNIDKIRLFLLILLPKSHIKYIDSITHKSEFMDSMITCHGDNYDSPFPLDLFDHLISTSHNVLSSDSQSLFWF